MSDLNLRHDLYLIANLIDENSKVLDIGCGEGELIAWLTNNRKISARGVELAMDGVRIAVSKGLSVIQGDAETEIKSYPDNSFDYAVLSLTLQTMKQPDKMLIELLRISKKAIVSIPNFGHLSARTHLFFNGTMPVTKSLPYQWWNTPNIHFCTIKDFSKLCLDLHISIEKGFALNHKKQTMNINPCGYFANLFAEQAVFLIAKTKP